MTQGTRDLDSERTWFVLGVLAGATLLVALGKLPGPDWVKLVMILAGLVAHSAALAAPAQSKEPA